MPRRRQVAGLVLSTVVGVAAAGVLPAAPAYAAPVAHDDRYDVVAGGTYTLDPLANDETTWLSTGALSFCGLGSYNGQHVYAEEVDGRVVVEVRREFRGTTTLTYDACQRSARDTGTITLDVVRLADVRATKVRGVKGRVRFTNPNGATLKVSWGSASSGRPDATRSIRPRSALTVSTRRRSVYWVAFISHDGATVTLGDGVLTRLQTKK